MGSKAIAFIGIVLFASHVWAQTTPRTPQTPLTPQTAQTPPSAPPAPPPPPPPAPPRPPRREGQPINVRVDLTITEDGGTAPPIKKSVTAVVGDGYSGYVREQTTANPTPNGPNAFGRLVAPLNLDAYPIILANGKIRLSCSIQYETRQDELRMSTDIKQNLVLILESGRALVISQATDPVSDRRVTVEVTATILK